MLNLVIDGVVFEVQVVHSKMLGARKGMDAHKAYNQFRSFVEMFDMLDFDTKLDHVDLASEVALLAKVDQLERDLEAEQKERREEHAARGKEQATHAAALAEGQAALAGEQAAHAAARAEIVQLRVGVGVVVAGWIWFRYHA